MKPQTARHEKQVGAGAPQLGEPLSFPARCGETPNSPPAPREVCWCKSSLGSGEKIGGGSYRPPVGNPSRQKRSWGRHRRGWGRI